MRKLLSILLTLVLCIGLMPLTVVPVHAATDYDLWIAGTRVTSDNLEIDSTDDASITSGSATYDPQTQTLTLNDFNWSGKKAVGSNSIYSGILAEQDLTIRIEGTNALLADASINTTGNFYTVSADGYKLSFEGDGSLTIGTGTANTNYNEGYYAAIVANEVECTENFSGTIRASEPEKPTAYHYGVVARNSMTVNGGSVSIKSHVDPQGNWAKGIETRRLTVSNAVVTIDCETELHMPAYGLFNTDSISISVYGSGELYIDANKEDDSVGRGNSCAIRTEDQLDIHVDNTATFQVGGRALTGISLRYGMNTEGPMTISGKSKPLHCNYSRMDPVVQFVGSVTGHTEADGSDTGTPVNGSGYLSRFQNYKRIVVAASGTVYPLYVGGIQVTDSNATDVLGDGTVSYDASSKTLTLDGANITGSHLLSCSTLYTYDHHSDVWCSLYAAAIPGLTVYVKGDSTITAPDKMLSLDSGEISLDNSHGIYLKSYDSKTDSWLDAELKLEADLTVLSGTKNGVALYFEGRELTVSGSGTADLTVTGEYASAIYSYGYWETNAMTLTGTVNVNADSNYRTVSGSGDLGLIVEENASFTATSTNIGIYELRELASAGTVTITSTGGNGGAIQETPVTITGGVFTASGTTSALLYSPSKVVVSDGYAIFAGDDAQSAARQESNTYTGNAKYITVKSVPLVNIIAAENMTKTADSGEAYQTNLSGAMTDVVYEADDGYYFPADYAVASVNGVNVTRNDFTKITVSGTPTARADITLIAPTAKTAPAAPSGINKTDCTTAANNDGTIIGVDATMEYQKSGDSSWTAITGTSVTGLVPGTYSVRIAAAGMALASDAVSVTIAEYTPRKADTPVFTPGSQSFTDSIDVTITCALNGATVYYTDDGSTPSATNGTVTTGAAITLDATKTLKAIAVMTGYDDSDIATATYTKAAPSSGGGSTPAPETYAVTPGSAENGKITVSPENAAEGDKVTVTVTPDEGYELDSLTVKDKDGNEIKVTEKDGVYTFTMPASEVDIEATFKEAEEEPAPADDFPFVDVPEDAYYRDAVEWAVETGVTGGTSPTTFSPKKEATRGQAMTFLWAAAGAPEPKTTVNPFKDISEDDYYYKAILWAYENGITAGISAEEFGPEVTVTRAQVATFLYGIAGRPDTGSEPFADVNDGDYFALPVAWAFGEGITSGTSETTFNPDADCLREQIITFMYLYFAE